MERPITIITEFTEYKPTYTGIYSDYYQIHIFSVPQIISTYYDPEKTTVINVKQAATTLLNTIRERSNRKQRISMFEKDGKFLITESEDVVDVGELLTFFPDKVRYDYDMDSGDLTDIFNDRRIDQFFKDGLVTVGAPELFEVIEPHIKNKQENHDSWLADNDELRKLNKTDPKFTLKVYYIGKDYKPLLKQSYLVHNEDALYLPEYKNICNSSRRLTVILEDNATKKSVEFSLKDAIDGVRFEDEMRRNPSIIDLGALQRMELDSDDPDFLSMDDYVGEWNGDN